MEWISVSCGKSIKCVCEGSSFSPFNVPCFVPPFILLLFSGSPCCTWTATSVWTCHQKKTSWFPPSETATTAAPSSGCSVTWPWASDSHLGRTASAPVLHDPRSPPPSPGGCVRVRHTSVYASAWTGYMDWRHSRLRSIMWLFPFIAAASVQVAAVSETSFSWKMCAQRKKPLQSASVAQAAVKLQEKQLTRKNR